MTLNAAQLLAVLSTAALRVVIAGPGSGKTRTMVEAVKSVYLEPPNETRIAVMTFTNAGANEFRNRLGPIKLAHCGTLHSYAFKLIQRFGGFLGYIPGKVGILPEAERIPRLLQCRDKLGMAKVITQKALLEPTNDAKDERMGAYWLVWKEYQFLLKRSNLVDYDLILQEGLALLQMPEVRAQVKLDYLFVDEYQDSASIDQRIYDEIPATNKMYVGDLDQSIFGFRGAYPIGLLMMVGQPEIRAEVHKLELNYRSDMAIATAANKLIAHNKERVEKLIIPVSTEIGHVHCNGFEEVAQELASIVHTLRLWKWGERGMATAAVLYRMNHDVKVCRDYLQAMGLPVQMPKFEQRPADWEEAKLLLGLAIAPTEILVDRYLKLKFDPREVERWRLESLVKGGLFIECARIKMPTDWTDRNPRSAYLYLSMNGVSEATIRLMQERTQLLAPDAGLDDLLHDLHSGEEPKASNEVDGIHVGTIHSAKGREWDVVFLPAFEQGIIPHLRTKMAPLGGPGSHGDAEVTYMEKNVRLEPDLSALEEDRRLAFVAVTRAKHELYISHCAHRRGPWGPVGLGQPSQFLSEMGLA